MLNASVKASWYPGAQQKLKGQPDKVMYAIASITLDMAYPTIPLSNQVGAGKLRQTSKSAGVRGSNNNYHIGSYTDYAKYVYNRPDSTNWTTPGTNPEWYKRMWKKKGNSILDNAVGRNQLK